MMEDISSLVQVWWIQISLILSPVYGRCMLPVLFLHLCVFEGEQSAKSNHELNLKPKLVRRSYEHSITSTFFLLRIMILTKLKWSSTRWGASAYLPDRSNLRVWCRLGDTWGKEGTTRPIRSVRQKTCRQMSANDVVMTRYEASSAARVEWWKDSCRNRGFVFLALIFDIIFGLRQQRFLLEQRQHVFHSFTPLLIQEPAPPSDLYRLRNDNSELLSHGHHRILCISTSQYK